MFRLTEEEFQYVQDVLGRYIHAKALLVSRAEYVNTHKLDAIKDIRTRICDAVDEDEA